MLTTTSNANPMSLAKIAKPQDRLDYVPEWTFNRWLAATALADIQLQHVETQDDTSTELVGLIETETRIALDEDVQFAIGYEYNSDDQAINFGSASLAITGNNWELALGKDTPVNGQYYSHFISGPVTQFTEIDSHFVQLTGDPAWLPGTTASVFYAQAVSATQRRKTGDYMGVTLQRNDQIANAWQLNSFVSYQHNLLAVDSFATEPTFTKRSVDAINLSLALSNANQFWQLTGEYSAALSHFDGATSRPRGLNIESAWRTTPNTMIALRLANNHQLGSNQQEYGAGITHDFHPKIRGSLEVMYRPNDNQQGDSTSALARLLLHL